GDAMPATLSCKGSRSTLGAVARLGDLLVDADREDPLVNRRGAVVDVANIRCPAKQLLERLVRVAARTVSGKAVRPSLTKGRVACQGDRERRRALYSNLGSVHVTKARCP